jgi:ornithine decarboxylase
VLNVGGGFPAPYPGEESLLLEQYFAAVIMGWSGLGLPRGCLLLSEPGRSLVATGGSVVVQVLVRKERCIYINDGIFGNLQELRHPKERRPARVIGSGRAASEQTTAFRVYGPTCDSDDVLGAPLMLPDDVAEGDWIEIGMMGAYSLALRTSFNGFKSDAVVSVDN